MCKCPLSCRTANLRKRTQYNPHSILLPRFGKGHVEWLKIPLRIRASWGCVMASYSLQCTSFPFHTSSTRLSFNYPTKYVGVGLGAGVGVGVDVGWIGGVCVCVCV